MKRVRKAVVPAAGLGTRFLPATKAIPKEMIPIVDTPTIQLIVEEAVSAGIEQIILITGRNKQAIEDHFDYAFEVDKILEEKKNFELLEASRKSVGMCEIVSIRQKEPKGLGHAVLCAESLIGDEPFAVLLGDDLIDSPVPCISQLIRIYEEFASSVVAIMEVAKEEVSKYGIVSGIPVRDRLLQLQTLVEKPDPANAPSQFAIPGRYVLTPQIFKCLREVKPGRGNEIQLTDALQLLAKREKMFAYKFEGKRFDLGDRLGFLEANIHYALKRPEMRVATLEILRRLTQSL